ncbi:MAG: type II toxin-antitoxin system HigB family toxin [Deltaproteobacteria bacterium]|nr:type II toxin-antitoxin system HigB family toxin [Deltaproteobacteria bacterium]
MFTLKCHLFPIIANFAELRAIFPSADQVEGLTVFNLGGNKARIIAAIHYITQRLYIRHVLTHSEYDKKGLVIRWATQFTASIIKLITI